MLFLGGFYKQETTWLVLSVLETNLLELILHRSESWLICLPHYELRPGPLLKGIASLVILSCLAARQRECSTLIG